MVIFEANEAVEEFVISGPGLVTFCGCSVIYDDLKHGCTVTVTVTSSMEVEIVLLQD